MDVFGVWGRCESANYFHLHYGLYWLKLYCMYFLVSDFYSPSILCEAHYVVACDSNSFIPCCNILLCQKITIYVWNLNGWVLRLFPIWGSYDAASSWASVLVFPGIPHNWWTDILVCLEQSWVKPVLVSFLVRASIWSPCHSEYLFPTPVMMPDSFQIDGN